MTLVTDDTQTKAKNIERRRGLRVTEQRPVKMFDPTANRWIGGQTQDVGSAGLRLELPVTAHLAPGRFVSVHVGIGTSGMALANRRQMIPARVIWVDSSSDSTVSAGIEFLASISAHLHAA